MGQSPGDSQSRRAHMFGEFSMIATWVPAVLTPATPEHVSRAYRTAVTNLIGAPSDMAVAVLHAHCALETGHTKGMWCNNPKNVKAGAKHAGEFCCIKLNEILVREGKRKTIWFDPVLGELLGKDGPARYPLEPNELPPGHPQTRMRAYKTLAGGVQNQLGWLMGPNWREALNYALAGRPFEYVTAIHAKGYFTADLEPYRRAVVQLTATYLPVAVSTGKGEATAPIQPDDDQLCQDIAACHRFELPPDLRARIRAMQTEHVDDAMARVREDAKRDVSEGS